MTRPGTSARSTSPTALAEKGVVGDVARRRSTWVVLAPDRKEKLVLCGGQVRGTRPLLVPLLEAAKASIVG
ncbi:MAG: hypothetical protein ACYCXY_03290, partial [Acidimicrobiales bacterium]